MATNKVDEETAKVNVATFSKQQIIAAKRYKHSKDVLNVVLNNSQNYTLEEVDKLISKFMKSEVI